MSNHLMVTGSAYVADKKYYGFWLGCLPPPFPVALSAFERVLCLFHTALG